ncbi:MAG: LamG domain-containing protein, partial [Candidatus Omnitrophota bacterium]
NSSGHLKVGFSARLLEGYGSATGKGLGFDVYLRKNGTGEWVKQNTQILISALGDNYKDYYINVTQDSADEGSYEMRIKWVTGAENTAVQIKELFMDDTRYSTGSDLNRDLVIDDNDLIALREMLGNSKVFKAVWVDYGTEGKILYYVTKENGLQYKFYNLTPKVGGEEVFLAKADKLDQVGITHNGKTRLFKIREGDDGSVALYEMLMGDLNNDGALDSTTDLVADVAQHLYEAKTSGKEVTLESVQDALMRYNLHQPGNTEIADKTDLNKDGLVNSEDTDLMATVSALTKYVLSARELPAGLASGKIIVSPDDGAIRIYNNAGTSILKKFTATGAVYDYDQSTQKLLKFTDEDGVVTEYTYNPAGEPAGSVKVYSFAMDETRIYDPSGKLVKKQSPKANLTYTYSTGTGGTMIQTESGLADIGTDDDFSESTLETSRWIKSGDGTYNFNDGSLNLVRNIVDNRLVSMYSTTTGDSINILFDLEPPERSNTSYCAAYGNVRSIVWTDGTNKRETELSGYYGSSVNSKVVGNVLSVYKNYWEMQNNTLGSLVAEITFDNIALDKPAIQSIKYYDAYNPTGDYTTKYLLDTFVAAQSTTRARTNINDIKTKQVTQGYQGLIDLAVDFDPATGKIYGASANGPYGTFSAQYPSGLTFDGSGDGKTVTANITYSYGNYRYEAKVHFSGTAPSYTIDRIDMTSYDYYGTKDYTGSLDLVHNEGESVVLSSGVYSTTTGGVDGWVLKGDFDIQLDLSDLAATKTPPYDYNSQSQKELGGFLEIANAANTKTARIGVATGGDYYGGWSYKSYVDNGTSTKYKGRNSNIGQSSQVRIKRTNGRISLYCWDSSTGRWENITDYDYNRGKTEVDFSNDDIIVKLNAKNIDTRDYDAYNRHPYIYDLSLSMDNFKVNQGAPSIMKTMTPIDRKFDASGNLLEYTDDEGRLHTFTYETTGLPVNVSKRVREYVAGSLAEEKVYDSQERVLETKTTDLTTTIYDATLRSGAVTRSDAGRNYLYLNGDGAYTEIDEPINEDFSEGFTVSAWVSYNQFNYYSRIIDFGNGAASDNIMLYNQGYSGNLVFEVYNGSSSGGAIVANNCLVAGQWMHVVATVDKNGNAVIYVDGVEKARGTTAVPRNVERSKSYIGKSNWQDGYFEGGIDELSIFKTSVSAANVPTLASYAPTGKESDMALYYSFSGSLVKDIPALRRQSYEYSGTGGAYTTTTFNSFGGIREQFVYKGTGLIDSFVDASGQVYDDENFVSEDGTVNEYITASGRVTVASPRASHSHAYNYYGERNYGIEKAVDGLKTSSDNGWTPKMMGTDETAASAIFDFGIKKSVNTIDLTQGIGVDYQYDPYNIQQFELLYASDPEKTNITENFESGEFPVGFESGGNYYYDSLYRFYISDGGRNGSNALKVDGNKETYLRREIDADDNSSIDFYWRGSSFIFKVDGQVISSLSGYSDWTKVSANLTKGKHVIEWITENSQNTCYLDDLTIKNVKETVWKPISDLAFQNSVSDANVSNGNIVVRKSNQDLYSFSFAPIETTAIMLKVKGNTSRYFRLNEIEFGGDDKVAFERNAQTIETGEYLLENNTPAIDDSFAEVSARAGTVTFDLASNASQVTVSNTIEDMSMRSMVFTYSGNNIVSASGYYDLNSDNLFADKDSSYLAMLKGEYDRGGDMSALLAVGDMDMSGTITSADVDYYERFVINNEGNFASSDMMRYYEAIGTERYSYDTLSTILAPTAASADDWETEYAANWIATEEGTLRTIAEPESLKGKFVEFKVDIDPGMAGVYDLGLMAKNPYQSTFARGNDDTTIELDIYVNGKVNNLQNIDINNKIREAIDYDISYGKVYLEEGSNTVRLYVTDPNGDGDRFKAGPDVKGQEVGLEIMKIYIGKSGYSELIDSNFNGAITQEDLDAFFAIDRTNPDAALASSQTPYFSALMMNDKVYGIRVTPKSIFFDKGLEPGADPASKVYFECEKDAASTVWTVFLEDQYVEGVNDGIYGVTEENGIVTAFKLQSTYMGTASRAISVDSHIFAVAMDADSRYAFSDGTGTIFTDADLTIAIDGLRYRFDPAAWKLTPVVDIKAERVLILDDEVYGYLFKYGKYWITYDGKEYPVERKVTLDTANCTFISENGEYKVTWTTQYGEAKTADVTVLPNNRYRANVDGASCEFGADAIYTAVTFAGGRELEVVLDQFGKPVLKNTAEQKSKELTDGVAMELYRINPITHERIAKKGKLVYVIDSTVKPELADYKTTLTDRATGNLKTYLTALNVQAESITTLYGLAVHLIDNGPAHNYTLYDVVKLLTDIGISDVSNLATGYMVFKEKAFGALKTYLDNLSISDKSITTIDGLIQDLKTNATTENAFTVHDVNMLVLGIATSSSSAVNDVLATLRANASGALKTYLTALSTEEKGITNVEALLQDLRINATGANGYT